LALILHLLAERDWSAIPLGSAAYAPASIASEGFVHCTDGDAVLLGVANAFYVSAPGEHLVLTLDEDLLTSAVVREAPSPAPPPGHDVVLFPHVYGPLDLDAVVEVRRLVRDDDGRFVGLAAYDGGASA
jgi:uncharacterized protein (DUF952 family)